MRTLPHVVIACGTVWTGGQVLQSLRHARRSSASTSTAEGASSPAIDYRLVALGSVLPDLVDRVQRRWVRTRHLTPDHHLVGHTLLFSLGILLPGLFLAARSRDLRLLSVGVASFSHLLADPAVRSPRTLFWPALGFGFPAANPPSPVVTVVTQVGAALVVAQVVRALWRGRRLGHFIRTGGL
jgi:membrane-bound metal-dependent hydrolase YbcI (DUF457 family)